MPKVTFAFPGLRVVCSNSPLPKKLTVSNFRRENVAKARSYLTATVFAQNVSLQCLQCIETPDLGPPVVTHEIDPLQHDFQAE